jgi:3-hydroxyacyl-CoA dehydrogenase
LAIDEIIDPDVAVGSSSSGIPASAFTEDCRNRGNFLVAHPVNPPYLVPVVELVPSPWTAPQTVERVDSLMSGAGQVPVRVHGEVEGFILNRLQGALLREAWALFEEGYASAADIDRTVSHGLGLRWSFMGPFETIDLNAPGGVRDYAERLGDLYLSIAKSRTEPKAWDDDLIKRVEEERRDTLPLQDLPSRCSWRDRRLMALAAHKKCSGNGHD